MLFIIILLLFVILLKQKTPCISTEGLMTNLMLSEQIGLCFRVGQCCLSSHRHATGHVSDDRVPLPKAYAKAFAYALEARHAHVGPWAHAGRAVDEF